VGDVYMREMINSYEVGNLKEGDLLEDLGVEGSILNWVLK
jgi:hypothetical protein